jgi:hypothetical protein
MWCVGIKRINFWLEIIIVTLIKIIHIIFWFIQETNLKDLLVHISCCFSTCVDQNSKMAASKGHTWLVQEMNLKDLLVHTSCFCTCVDQNSYKILNDLIQYS